MMDLSRTTSAALAPGALAPVIQVQGAAVTLGRRTIWQEVQLAVQPGEFLAILGPNGAGKSTLLKAILGLIPLTRGTISVLGRSEEHTSELQSQVDLVYRLLLE